MAKDTDTKAERKISAAAGNNKAAYEGTAFGRRRIGKVPRWLTTLARFTAVPFTDGYRRFRGSGEKRS